MSENEEAIITCVSLTGYCVEEAMQKGVQTV